MPEKVPTAAVWVACPICFEHSGRPCLINGRLREEMHSARRARYDKLDVQAKAFAEYLGLLQRDRNPDEVNLKTYQSLAAAYSTTLEAVWRLIDMAEKPDLEDLDEVRKWLDR